jgi:hypothetical protein
MNNINFYLFHFLDKFFYFPNFLFNIRSSYKKIINNNYLLIKNKKIEFISDFILSKYYLNLLKIKREKKKILKKDKKRFYFTLNELFSKEHLFKINSILKDKEIVKKISYHFGYRVKYKEALIYYNYYNKNSPKNFVSKMWHRDNDSLYGQLKLFLICNKLSKKNDGYFYFIPKKYLSEQIRIISKEAIKDQTLSNEDKKARILDSDINKLNLTNKVLKHGDTTAEALILNTNDQYHKGGYIKKSGGFRVMVMATYLPNYFYIGNLSKYFLKYSFYKWTTIVLIGIKNRLRKKIYI